VYERVELVSSFFIYPLGRHLWVDRDYIFGTAVGSLSYHIYSEMRQRVG